MDSTQGTELEALRPRVMTVSELTARIKGLLEGELGPCWVEAEVGQIRQPASGHAYLVLKDDRAQLKAVIFKNTLRYLGFFPEEGLTVLAFGRLTVYEPRGEYQLVVDHLEPLGSWALALAFEQLKTRLEREGLFDPDRKRPLPPLVSRAAVVTSPTGAAIWDFLRVVKRRHPGLKIQVYPVRVQGEEAPAMIADALTDLAAMAEPPEVIVLTRGGGSLEDLQAFNTELVARAVAACPIPVVSAVGHEIDFTIADFVADVRAATPTAAAELLARLKSEAAAEIASLTGRLGRSLADRIAALRRRTAALERGLIDPRRRLINQRLSVDLLLDRLVTAVKMDAIRRRSALGRLTGRLSAQGPRPRLDRAFHRLETLNRSLAWRMEARLAATRARLAGAAERLEALSPLGVLGRGYSLTFGPDGRLITSAEDTAPGERVSVRLSRGRLECLVEETTNDSNGGGEV